MLTQIDFMHRTLSAALIGHDANVTALRQIFRARAQTHHRRRFSLQCGRQQQSCGNSLARGGGKSDFPNRVSIEFLFVDRFHIQRNTLVTIGQRTEVRFDVRQNVRTPQPPIKRRGHRPSVAASVFNHHQLGMIFVCSR